MASIPSTMKAIRINKFNQPYSLETIPTPDVSTLKPHSILVKVAAAGFCHTDNMVASGMFPTPLPITPSHEAAGTVAAIGSAIAHLQPGDRVVSGLQKNRCYRCKECTGPAINVQYCQNSDGAIGIMNDGAFAEYVVLDGREVGKMPEGLSFAEAAPLACAGVTMWRALYKAELSRGEWIAIVGAGGGLGHLGVGFAKAQGLKVVGIDTRQEALELARECGADLLVNGFDKQAREKVFEAIGDGVAATINLAESDAAVALACQITRTHGRLVQVGQPKLVRIPFEEIMFRDIRVVGTNNSTNEQFHAMLKAVSEGIKVKTTVFNGLESVPKLVEASHGGKIAGKAVLVVDPTQQ